MNRENVECVQRKILFSLEKEGSITVLDNMDEPGKH
jgi:hypothetical protein